MKFHYFSFVYLFHLLKLVYNYNAVLFFAFRRRVVFFLNDNNGEETTKSFALLL